MAKKVDMFSASKAMSVRVVDYMHTQVWNVVIKARLRKAAEKLAQEIESAENLRGSAIITEEQVDAIIAEKQAEFARTEEALQAELDKEATFAYTGEDKAFYKAYKAAEGDEGKIKAAIVEFCGAYDLKVEGTDLLAELADCVRGVKKASAAQIVKSGATQFTAARTKNDVLTVLYGRIAERMIEAGTIKPEKIPADVRAMYEKKNK